MINFRYPGQHETEVDTSVLRGTNPEQHTASSMDNEALMPGTQAGWADSVENSSTVTSTYYSTSSAMPSWILFFRLMPPAYTTDCAVGRSRGSSAKAWVMFQVVATSRMEEPRSNHDISASSTPR